MGLFVAKTNLSVSVEPPHVKTILSGKSCTVTKARGTTFDSGQFTVRFWRELNHLWSSNLTMTANT